MLLSCMCLLAALRLLLKLLCCDGEELCVCIVSLSSRCDLRDGQRRLAVE